MKTEFDATRAAVTLVDEARTAILDCRTAPLTDAVAELGPDDALRVVQALAMVAGTLAVADERVWAAVRPSFLRAVDDTTEGE